MSLYDDHVLPHLIGLACGAPQIMKQRARLIPAAQGRVLEIGFGAGPNLAFYDPARVERVFALEPSAGMRRKAAKAVAAAPVPVEMLDLAAEAIPLDAGSADTVVLTYTACTIPDVEAALAEMRRVLRPGGRLLFCEHGLSPDPGVARWQRRIEPVWRPIAGGCRLTRRPDALIAAAGFRIDRLETDYLPKTPRIAGFTYAGAAAPA